MSELPATPRFMMRAALFITLAIVLFLCAVVVVGWVSVARSI